MATILFQEVAQYFECWWLNTTLVLALKKSVITVMQHQHRCSFDSTLWNIRPSIWFLLLRTKSVKPKQKLSVECCWTNFKCYFLHCIVWSQRHFLGVKFDTVCVKLTLPYLLCGNKEIMRDKTYTVEVYFWHGRYVSTHIHFGFKYRKSVQHIMILEIVLTYTPFDSKSLFSYSDWSISLELFWKAKNQCFL